MTFRMAAAAAYFQDMTSRFRPHEAENVVPAADAAGIDHALPQVGHEIVGVHFDDVVMREIAPIGFHCGANRNCALFIRHAASL